MNPPLEYEPKKNWLLLNNISVLFTLHSFMIFIVVRRKVDADFSVVDVLFCQRMRFNLMPGLFFSFDQLIKAYCTIIAFFLSRAWFFKHLFTQYPTKASISNLQTNKISITLTVPSLYFYTEVKGYYIHVERKNHQRLLIQRNRLDLPLTLA